MKTAIQAIQLDHFISEICHNSTNAKASIKPNENFDEGSPRCGA